MKDNIEYMGFWWLPSDPENQVAGTLTFEEDNGNIQLNLIGSFQELIDFPQYEIVLGFTNKGKKITLFNCRTTKSTINVPGFSNSILTANYAFVDANFNDVNKMLFYKAKVSYDHLWDWASINNITHNEKRDAKQNYLGDTFDSNLPSDISATITEGKISVSYISHVNSSAIDLNFNFHQDAFLQIEPDRELSISELESRFIYPLQIFLTLATNQPNSVTSLKVYSRHTMGNAINSSSEHNPKEMPIEVFFKTKRNKKIKPHKKTIPKFRMLFALEDIEIQFSLFMQRWFNAASQVDSTCKLFFSASNKSEGYLQNHFLNLVQAAESYHRRRVKNQALSDDEHQTRINAILASAPSEYEEWLKEKLHFSNEPSLKERLNDLLLETKGALDPIITDSELFVKTVKNTRNYYTHWNKSLEKKAAKGEELFRLTQRLSFLVQTCLLIEIGFTPDRCATILGKNKEYQFIRSRVASKEKG